VTWVSILYGPFKDILSGHRFTKPRHFLFSDSITPLGSIYLLNIQKRWEDDGKNAALYTLEQFI
jgi:hypothetical protein